MSRNGAFVVTGSGSGIGQALAHKLTAEGHFVFGVGRQQAKLEKTAQALPKDLFTFAAADLADAKSSRAVSLQIRSWLTARNTPLLGLVNNAGVFDRMAFHLTSDVIWERHFHNNLISAVRLTRELYPLLKASAPSSVLNISSSLGVRPIAFTAAYSAMKAAMINWTKTLALEWANEQIRVNCLCPGIVDTPIHAFHAQNENDPDRLSASQAQPLGRLGQPNDIAEAGAFLLSNASSWTTGSIVTIDGGISL